MDEFKRQLSIRVIEPRSRQQERSSISDETSEKQELRQRGPRKHQLKKNTLLGMKKMKKQRIDQVFKSIIKSISFKPHQRENDWNSNSINIPDSLTNTLYRQNIRNYNPYIATLEQLEQEKSLTPYQKEKISNLCHIGIAKNFIKTKKYSLAPKYTTVNVLIRSYMCDKMLQEVNLKEQTYDSVFFIPATATALTFNSRSVPKGVLDLMPQEYYTSIINEVNNIITHEYVRYRESNLLTVAESLSGKLILGLLFLLSLIFCIKQSVYLLPVIFIVGVMYIFYLVYETRSKLERLVQSKNVNSTIMERITALFESIRTDMIEWKVGQDFYWLQIHYIKKKNKRNYSID